jgi:DNA polymerase (family 10)
MGRGEIALERAEKTAEAIIKLLAPFCERIEVAGSIRRRCPWVNDIDLVMICRDPWNLRSKIAEFGLISLRGEKLMRVMVNEIQVDIYFATPKTWATLLLIRTGSKENNIRLATRAKKMGWHLAASGEGLFNEKGERVAGDTEESIYEALGLAYQRPEERG